LKDGGGAFGLGTPIDPEDAEFEKELVEETTRRRAEAFKQRALEGPRENYPRLLFPLELAQGMARERGSLSALGTGFTRCFREWASLGASRRLPRRCHPSPEPAPRASYTSTAS
jgi:hypothetical protein